MSKSRLKPSSIGLQIFHNNAFLGGARTLTFGLFLYPGGDNIAREFSRKFYKTQAWRKCKDGYGQSKGWLCEDCLARGLYTPGREVHHLQELTPQNINDPAVTLNWDNLRLLCKDCHAARHKKERAGRYIIGDGGEIIIL